MIAAGVEMGFPPEQARLLAIRTVAGAAKMLDASSDSPQELRRKVTSPGGTTQAAITHLESARFGQALIDAIKAAERRGKELSAQGTRPGSAGSAALRGGIAERACDRSRAHRSNGGS